MPGTEPAAVARVVRDVLAQEGGVPFLAELPERGPGADLVGRGLGMLSRVWPAWAAETGPTGWRLCDAPGRDARRAGSYLSEDLDVLEEVYDGWDGPLLLPLAGPWTLAASVELTGGERVVRDPGAVRDLAQSWSEAARQHVADVRQRVPGAHVVLQADEPSLPAVLAGSIPTASGMMRYRALDEAVVRDTLVAVVRTLAAADIELVVHCCAAEVPLPLLRAAGVAGVSLDLNLVTPQSQDELGELVQAEVRLGLGLGIEPGTGTAGPGGPASGVGASVGRVTMVASQLGFTAQDFAAGVTISPSCGVAGSSPAAARAALVRAYDIGRALRGQEGSR